jgi:F-type H+-transporting ATPase subunit k
MGNRVGRCRKYRKRPLTRERACWQLQSKVRLQCNSPQCPSKSFLSIGLLLFLAGTEAIHAAHSSTILGRAIKTEYLALGTLLSTVGLSYAATSGGSKAAPSGSKQTLQEVKGSVKFDSSSK